eukprot:TRINITY_DN6701_c0_g1_i2.p1 TRINITY_DN6701_c0_g1~~TRINITY_DN6701_c0_g1_i2.p1  ORF type:complete len:793 (+),score=132.22 TRINITY_DN6701_c0_g1_i2:75-2453(+)
MRSLPNYLPIAALFVVCSGELLNADDECRIQNHAKTKLLLNRPYDCPPGYGCKPKVPSGFVLDTKWSCQEGSEDLILSAGDICKYEGIEYPCTTLSGTDTLLCGDQNLCTEPALGVGSPCDPEKSTCERGLLCRESQVTSSGYSTLAVQSVFTCIEPPKNIPIGSDCSIGTCIDTAICLKNICQKGFLDEGDFCEAKPILPPPGYVHIDCKEGLYCHGGETHNTCVRPTPCDEESLDSLLNKNGESMAVFCDARKQCPEGMVCSGCKPTKCVCSFSGEVICNDVCHPFCEVAPPSAANTNSKLGTEHYCSTPMFDWSYDQQEFCCSQHWIGCTTEPYDCTVPVANITVSDFESQLRVPSSLQIASDYTYTKDWAVDKKDFCCSEYGVSCFDHQNQECDPSAITYLWSPSKRRWCCAHHGVFCEVQTLEMKQELSEYKVMCSSFGSKLESWSLSRNASCCLGIGVACLPRDHDCNKPTTELSKEAKDWCCTHKNQHCMYKCSFLEPMLHTHREYCCRMRGTFCQLSPDYAHHLPDFPFNGSTPNTTQGRSWSFHQLRLKVGYWEIAASMRMKFSQVRMTVIKMSPRLRDRPDTVHITAIGAVKPITSHPEEDNKNSSDWGTVIPDKWNAEDSFNSTDLLLIQKLTSLENQPLSIWKPESYPEPEKGDRGITIDFIVYGGPTPTEETIRWLDNVHSELQQSTTQGQLMKGPLSDNWFGHSLFAYPSSYSRKFSGEMRLKGTPVPYPHSEGGGTGKSMSTVGLVIIIAKNKQRTQKKKARREREKIPLVFKRIIN